MEQIRDTEKLLLFKEQKDKITAYYRQHKEDKSNALVLTHEIKDDIITCHVESGVIKKIVLLGFDEIPTYLSSAGYGFRDTYVSSFFKYKFIESKYDTIIISSTELTANPNELFFLEDEFEELLSNINKEQRACNDTKNILITNYLLDRYPSLAFDYKQTNNNKDLILRNLNSKLIDKLTADDVEAIGKFYVDAAQKYTRPDIVKRMVTSLQKNAKLLSLQEVIKTYEKLLKDEPAEAEWQKFFAEYITLFDNRYAHKLDYKNIATGVTKYPDLVLVDIYGYVDFYELKKNDMQLLQFDKSHNTHYWSKDVAMVIAQVSDYLQKAREHASNYAAAIKRETATDADPGIEVNIIQPRGIIVAGSKKELNTAKKMDHFKMLRESLKDIEFVLYDELLDRLKNLLNSIK